MTEKQPLKNIGVLLTRPEKQGAELASVLRGKGARVVTFPTIKIESLFPENRTEWKKLFKSIGQFRWILFTSVNGAEIFVGALTELGFERKDLKSCRIGVIGEKTGERLQKFGFTVDCCPDAEDYRAEGLLDALLEKDGDELRHGARVLLARAQEAREVLPEELSRCGAKVTDLAVYHTIASQVPIDPILEALKSKSIQCLTFTSSSTVRFFFEKLKGVLKPNDLHGLVFACIGPVTAETLREFGIEPKIVSTKFTTAALVGALENFYSR